MGYDLSDSSIVVARPGPFGGGERLVSMVCKALRPLGGVTMLSSVHLQSEHDLRAQVRQAGCKVLTVPELFLRSRWYRVAANSVGFAMGRDAALSLDRVQSRYRRVFWQGAGMSLLEKHDLAVLVGQPNDFFADAVRSAEAARCRIAVVLTGAVSGGHCRKPHYRAFLEQLSRVDLVLVHNERDCDRLQADLGFTGRAAVVEQAALCEQELLRLPPVLSNERTRFGLIGRFHPNKRFETVLRELASLPPSGNWELIIVGDDGRESGLRARAEQLGCEAKVRFLGVRRESEMPSVYEQLDAVIIASGTESGPFVGVDAMAAGRILVSTKVGAMPMRLTGFPRELICAASGAGLRQALEAAMGLHRDAEACRKYTRRIREKYLAEHRLESILGRYQTLFSRR